MIPCPYCASGEAGTRICPRSDEICAWCCVRCSASRCSTGAFKTYWPAAVKLALSTELGRDLESSVRAWVETFKKTLRFDPELPMIEAATSVLIQRQPLPGFKPGPTILIQGIP